MAKKFADMRGEGAMEIETNNELVDDATMKFRYDAETDKPLSKKLRLKKRRKGLSFFK